MKCSLWSTNPLFAAHRLSAWRGSAFFLFFFLSFFTNLQNICGKLLPDDAKIKRTGVRVCACACARSLHKFSFLCVKSVLMFQGGIGTRRNSLHGSADSALPGGPHCLDRNTTRCDGAAGVSLTRRATRLSCRSHSGACSGRNLNFSHFTNSPNQVSFLLQIRRPVGSGRAKNCLVAAVVWPSACSAEAEPSRGPWKATTFVEAVVRDRGLVRGRETC